MKTKRLTNISAAKNKKMVENHSALSKDGGGDGKTSQLYIYIFHHIYSMHVKYIKIHLHRHDNRFRVR